MPQYPKPSKLGQLSLIDLESYYVDLTLRNKKNNSDAILTLPPVLTVLTLPYKEVKNEHGKKALFYEKTIVKNQTKYSLSIRTGLKKEYDEHGNYELYGIPYGIYARLLLYYICSEVIKTGEKTITLGSNYSEIFNNLKISENGRKIGGSRSALLKDQIDRLINSHIVFNSTRVHSSNNSKKNYTKTKTEFLHLVKEVEQIEFWDKDPEKQQYGYQIKITDDFFNMIVQSSNVIFDYNLIPKLKESPLALDLALHLNHWAYNATFVAKRDLFISYSTLFDQFGSQSAKKHFTEQLKIALKKIAALMPDLRIQESKDGFFICKGSLPSVSVKQNLIARLINDAKAGLAVKLQQELDSHQEEGEDNSLDEDEIPY